jgi:RNA polymerase sigma factor (sigma-70 family)
MASGTPVSFYRDLDLIAGSATVAGLGDAELLSRYAQRRDATAEAAFEALVARHGPMVLATCRRSLRDGADADDAFQAAFLVLARKAGSVRVAGSVGPWLHAVAERVALKARVIACKRRDREGGEIGDIAAPDSDEGAFEIRQAVHDELGRLPEKYRAPLVLCHFEGLTHEQAAEALRWPVGTVSGRLSRAREILRDRLTRRGLGVPASAVVAALSARVALAVSSEQIQTVVRAACGGAVSRSVFRLTRGVLIAMFMNKLKLMGTGLAAVTALTVGAGFAAGQFGRQVAQEPPQVPTIETKPASSETRKEYTKEFMKARSFSGPTIQAIQGGNYIAVQSSDGRSISATSLKDPSINKNDWLSYAVPAGLSVIPLNVGNVMPLAYAGDEIKEVAVFFGSNQGPNTEALWSKQTLREPARGRLSPITSGNVVLYQVGADLYAFSSLSGQWGLLHLAGAEPPTIQVGFDSILVQQKETLYVYKAFTGRWTTGVSIKPVVTPPVYLPGNLSPPPSVAPSNPPPAPQKK